jgi:hypothetical protein
VAVSVIVVLPASCGVPVTVPVVVFSVAQLGNPVAAQLVTGRFVPSVSEKVLLNAVPTAPEAVCPAVMIGTPSAIVKAILAAALVSPPPVAVKKAVNEPLAVGVPVIAPVLVFSVSPAGNPAAIQDVAGLFCASSSAGVAENAVPTAPEKLCPLVIIGDPAEMVKIKSSVSLPDDTTIGNPSLPVAVMEAVKDPAVVGVPVIAPVDALIEIPAGSPVADHEETGRFVASVSNMFCENANPTFPVRLCPAVMIGVPIT